MSPFFIGALVGGTVALVGMAIVYTSREQRFAKIIRSVTEPTSYAALYYYASFKRFRNSFKFFDSFGALYLSGDTLSFKTTEGGQPFVFNLKDCTVQDEGNWRMLKWFSVTTPAGEKFYFNSHKLGFLKNNSEETVKGLAAIQAQKAAAHETLRT